MTMTTSETIPFNATGKCHPACEVLPEMPDDQFRELVADIRENKQRQPIQVDEDGLILDGRHRWKACHELGIKPLVQTIRNITEAGKVALIISENIHRRHLTVQQRAAVAAELAGRLAEAARERQLAGKAVAQDDVKGKATEQAAKMVGGVSTRTVDSAVQRMREDPEAHAKAKAGTLPRKRPAPATKISRSAAAAVAATHMPSRFERLTMWLRSGSMLLAEFSSLDLRADAAKYGVKIREDHIAEIKRLLALFDDAN